MSSCPDGSLPITDLAVIDEVEPFTLLEFGFKNRIQECLCVSEFIFGFVVMSELQGSSLQHSRFIL